MAHVVVYVRVSVSNDMTSYKTLTLELLSYSIIIIICSPSFFIYNYIQLQIMHDGLAIRMLDRTRVTGVLTSSFVSKSL